MIFFSPLLDPAVISGACKRLRPAVKPRGARDTGASRAAAGALDSTAGAPTLVRRATMMSNDRRHIRSGSVFEEQIGYSRAVVSGDFVFVSGTTGFDYAKMELPEGIVAQCEQALANIERALHEAGATLEDIVRVRYILPDRADFEPCWPALRRAFGAAPPAATMMIAGLLDPRMRIEIEVTAKRPRI
jgi:enamine deaminase RidA (YjgF/YER057c/UK114 family)